LSNWRQPARIRRQGRQARHDGLGLGDNPYAESAHWMNNSLVRDWADGWREADASATELERHDDEQGESS
jgi:hypothetical protein